MLAATLSHGSRRGSWNTALIAGCVPTIGCPSIAIAPALGWSSPAVSRSSVVLPQPEPPSSATISPLCATMCMPRSASVPSA